MKVTYMCLLEVEAGGVRCKISFEMGHSVLVNYKFKNTMDNQ